MTYKITEYTNQTYIQIPLRIPLKALDLLCSDFKPRYRQNAKSVFIYGRRGLTYKQKYLQESGSNYSGYIELARNVPKDIVDQIFKTPGPAFTFAPGFLVVKNKIHHLNIISPKLFDKLSSKNVEVKGDISEYFDNETMKYFVKHAMSYSPKLKYMDYE